MIRSTSRSLAALVISLGACPLRTTDATDFRRSRELAARACQLRFRCSHVVLQLRKNVDGKRRARDDRFWLDDVQQNDFASELFGKSQRVLKRVFRHVRKINRHENFFEIQNLRHQFHHLFGFHNLSFHMHGFSATKEPLAQQHLLNRVHFLR